MIRQNEVNGLKIKTASKCEWAQGDCPVAPTAGPDGKSLDCYRNLIAEFVALNGGSGHA